MSRIPRTFHFVFGLREQTEPFHLAHYICLASCLEVNRPDIVMFHYRHMPYGPWWNRIKQRLHLNRIEEDAFMASYRYKDPDIAPFRYAHLSDITRLQVLLEYGGVYADIDTIFVRPLPDDLYAEPCVMGKERVDWTMPAARQAGGSLCNAFIMAERGSSFVRAWLDSIYAEFDGSWSAHSTFLPYRLSQQHPMSIRIEPERSFFHLDWSREGIRQLFERSAEDLEDVYNLHLWSHLWWDRSRTGFTCFHEGRLTPAYIAYAHTTYSKLARRFLPPDLELDAKAYRRTVWLQQLENIRLKIGL